MFDIDGVRDLTRRVRFGEPVLPFKDPDGQ
jgi:hypothetical protein